MAFSYLSVHLKHSVEQKTNFLVIEKKIHDHDPSSGKKKMTVTKETADANLISMKASELAIPEGIYCYRIKEVISQASGAPLIRTDTCPYWAAAEVTDHVIAGYCAFLKRSDLDDDSGGLLFDLIKECGINDNLDAEDFA